jgi:tetratricopeptide (TPR) repeat protein
LRLDPLRPGAHINLGAVYNRLEEFEEAIPALRRGIQLDPHRAEGYYNLGLVYKNTSQTNLAVQAYLEATRINPRMVDAHYNLANIYLELGKYAQAITHYRKVLELRPNWDKAMDGLAQAEGALEEESPAPKENAKKQPAPQVAEEKEPAASDDPNRIVDPYLHGALLTTLHQATIESENHGRQFLQILEAEVEAAIKDLSACLLNTSHNMSLTQCVTKFEEALQKIRTVQKDLNNTLERAKNIGDRLLKS